MPPLVESAIVPASVATQPNAGQRAEFIAVMALTTAMSALAIDTLLPAFPEIRAHHGLGAESTRVSLLIASFFLGSGIGQVPFGILSDRFGRKVTLYASLLLYSVAAFATAYAPSLGAMIIARFVWGLGAAGPRVITTAMVRDRFEGSAMAKTLSYIMTVFTIVPVVAPALGALLLHVIGWRATVLFPAFIAVVLTIWMLRIPETLPVERRRVVSPRIVSAAFSEVIRVKRTMALTLALSLLLAGINAYISLAEIITDQLYERKAQFAITFGAIAGAMAVAGMLNAFFVGKFGLRTMLRRTPILLSLAGAGFASISLVASGKPPFIVYALFLALILGLQVLVLPNCNSLALQPLGHIAGFAAGMIGTLSTIGGAVLGGAVAQLHTGTTMALATGFAAFSFGALILTRLGTRALPA